jgi:protein O-mannosyl-transferase
MANKKPAKTVAAHDEMQGSTIAASGRWRGWLGLAVVLAVTAFLYAPARNHAFTNWDDDRQITENLDIRDLSPQGVGRMFSHFVVTLYQPLTTLTFALEYRLSGLDPRIYHSVNILLHLANVLLVFVLARSLSQNAGISAATAALFAVHPLHVEVAAWASSLSTVLSATFYLATLIVYIAYVRSGKARYFIAALALFVLGLGAKTTAGTLPLVLVTIDIYLQRKICRRTIVEKIPFFLLAAAFGGITMLARSGASRVQEYAFRYSFVQRICIVCYCCLWYVAKLVFPAHLSAFYPFPTQVDGWLPAVFYLAPVLLLGVAVGTAYAGRYRRLLAFAGLFMLASLVLVVQIVPVSDLMVCDRYAYIPSVALFFLAATLGHRIGTRGPARQFGVLIALVLILGVLGTATYRRVGVWRDSMTLWNDVIAKRQDVWVAYQNRGMVYYERGNPQAAIADCDRALALYSDAAMALSVRAASHARLGDTAAALRDFDSAIRITPNATFLMNRGILKRNTGDMAGAVKDFSEIIQLDPRHVRAWYERADTYRMQGSWARAATDYEAVLKLNPAHAKAALLLGAALVETGDNERAVVTLNNALALGYPDRRSVYLLLAQAYQKMGRTDLAQQAANHAEELKFKGQQVP